jgi:hypothetical protein
MTGKGTGETDGGPDSMAYKPFDSDALIDAAAPLLQLRIDPEFRAGIKFNLKAASKMAALVEQVKLDEHAEPAPTFKP